MFRDLEVAGEPYVASVQAASSSGLTHGGPRRSAPRCSCRRLFFGAVSDRSLGACLASKSRWGTAGTVMLSFDYWMRASKPTRMCSAARSSSPATLGDRWRGAARMSARRQGRRPDVFAP